MIENILALLPNVLVLYSFVVIGWILGKKLDIGVQEVSKLLIYFFIPIIVFFATYNIPLEIDVLLIPIILFVVAWTITAITFYALKPFIEDKTIYIV
jgi:predicted permease